MRVLVADDNPVFRQVLNAMLTNWGYEVVLASDGAEAWAHLEPENGPRVAVLDWTMPELDGIEVCRRVRAANRQRYVYLLVLTSKAQLEDLVEALAAGADDYVTKPFKSPELSARLRTGCRIIEFEDRLVAARLDACDHGPGCKSGQRPSAIEPPAPSSCALS